MSALMFHTHRNFIANRRLQPAHDGGYMEDSYDYGLYWYDAHRNTYRLTWIGPLGRTDDSAPAGELYVVRLGDGVTEFLCTIPPVHEDHRPSANVDSILDGWAEICGTPNSLDWVRDRVAEAIRVEWARPPHSHV